MGSTKNSLFIVLFAFASINAFAENDSCGSGVKVDCQKHTIQIDNDPEKTVDCGAGGSTPTTKGHVGGPHNGDIVKDGVEIEAPGMGNDGGGKVFHTWEVNGKATNTQPTGQDDTQGCVVIDLETLNKLKTCKNAPLDIVGNGPGNHITDGKSGGQQQTIQHSPSGVVY